MLGLMYYVGPVEREGVLLPGPFVRLEVPVLPVHGHAASPDGWGGGGRGLVAHRRRVSMMTRLLE